MLRSLVFGVAMIAASAATVPAAAAISTFAQFTTVGTAPNVRWVNNGVAANSSAKNTATGTGGYFYSTTTGSTRVPGNVAVKFRYLQPQLIGLGPISANFLMNITVASGTPATASGIFRLQDIPSGGFSFTSTQAFAIGSTSYAIGTNLLTGTFTSGTIFGTQTAGSFSGNSQDGALVYTSDVLNFASTINRDYSLSLTSITPTIFRSTTGGAKALRTFRAVATGEFSSDPAPLVNGVPEPEVWGLMVVGFGLIGVQVRRSAHRSVVAA